MRIQSIIFSLVFATLTYAKAEHCADVLFGVSGLCKEGGSHSVWEKVVG